MTRFWSCGWHVIPVQLHKELLVLVFHVWRCPSGSLVMPSLNLRSDMQSVKFSQTNDEVDDGRAIQMIRENTLIAFIWYELYAILSLSAVCCIDTMEACVVQKNYLEMDNGKAGSSSN
ncbi:hypothetical protein TEA_029763 [Camellia sinensis var. sinensis]|uniref:Uncharacterized protein n=1 Tax=Camellia sinensis var. sinensis TaxID=542762 RepID=A0A4S4DFS5_CAMSN|nr:hypothetical protein TEA_029763 [Camellia sinensis var. sinensis]